MNVYIAGNNRERAASVACLLNDQEVETPCRWWEDLWRYTPAEDLHFIAECDALVFLWGPDQESARYETGMAMALQKQIIAVHDDPKWFLTLPNVVVVSNDLAAVEHLS